MDEATCPVCNERVQGSVEELNSHVEMCLRKVSRRAVVLFVREWQRVVQGATLPAFEIHLVSEYSTFLTTDVVVFPHIETVESSEIVCLAICIFS